METELTQFADDADAIHEIGHRVFIGGRGDYWNDIGTLQLDFLKSEGLKRSDVLVDIACGSLRAGAKLIPYLDSGNYLGVEKHLELLIYGVADELGTDLFRTKRPQFVVSDAFEFHKLGKRPNFALAQSLFSHLDPADIRTCLTNLRRSAADGCRLFATFHPASERRGEQGASHSWRQFYYTADEMAEFGRSSGWAPRLIGDWAHPRGQHMMEYVRQA